MPLLLLISRGLRSRGLRGIFAVMVVITLITPASSAPADDTEKPAGKPIKALLVTGGCCHDYARQKQILTKGISARANVQWTIVHQGGSKTDSRIPLYQNEDWADGFDIVVHNECFANVKDLDYVERILKPHRNGTPAILIHCAMHCYRTGTDHWFEFCGLQSPRHGSHYAYEVENLKSEHPIMKEFGESWTTPKGELYYTVKHWPTCVPLAQAKRKDNGEPQTCVWTNQYGKGRVFGTTIGHYNEIMVEPTYLDMLTRGLLWATGRDVEAEFHPASDEDTAAIRELVKAPLEPVPDLKPQSNLDIKGNKALKQNVSASSEERGKKNYAANAVDGDLATRWCASGAGTGQTWQVDLGEPQKIGAIRIYWEKNNAAYRYRVESSLDGSTWAPLVDRADNDKVGQVTDHTFDPIETRHLRVTFLGSSTGAWGSFWEFVATEGDLPKVTAIKTKQSGATAVATISDVKAPEGFQVRMFGAPPDVNYPVCLTTSIDGAVLIGVDPQGSLGKKAGDGKVLFCRDLDDDGRADVIREFCRVDHPRGLVYDAGRLWVLHPPYLTLFTDVDGDGVADEQKQLLEGISTDQVAKRGADHTTNGIALGADGWVYIAVGDFGFVNATGTDGKPLTLRGGGVARIRPDGSGLEMYAVGLRNIVDVGVDPLMNLFTRDNTNDGGGWDIRLSHIIQSANYGYPSQYLNFAEEIMPPLADYGGGSGCGVAYLDDARWPKPFSDAFYSCDWGRSEIYRHSLPREGATFTAHQESFLKIPRPTDMEIDGTGRLYVASWKNGKFAFSGENVGFVAQVLPADYTPHPAPEPQTLSPAELIDSFVHPSAMVRLHLSRELLTRDWTEDVIDHLRSFMADRSVPDASRTLAIWTLKQKLGSNSHEFLTELADDPSPIIRTQVLRALTDRLDELDGTSAGTLKQGLFDDDQRVVAQAIISIGRFASVTEAGGFTEPLLAIASRQPDLNINGDVRAHKLPDPDRVLPHLAVQNLRKFAPASELVAALTGDHRVGAIRALREVHDETAVAGVISLLNTTRDQIGRRELLGLLARLYHREDEYNGSWWGTRPDTKGPHYDRATWEASDRIGGVLKAAILSADSETRTVLVAELDRHGIKLDIPLPKGMKGRTDSASEMVAVKLPEVDPNDPAILANLSFETVQDQVVSLDGDPVRGQKLFIQQSCNACHSVADGEAPKGPHLVDIGKRSPVPELVESLLKPSQKIAQGFDSYTFLMADGKTHSGFVTRESADTIEIRGTDGLPKTLGREYIEFQKKQDLSMMPKGIVGNLKPEDLADLVAYLRTLRSS